MPAPTLGEVSRGKDNNLNLIRLVAALAVLVSHAWIFAYGNDATEPLTRATGHTLGTLAVFVFFIISGFLIARSAENARSPSTFFVARALRVWPGLVVSLILVAFVLGPLCTTLPLREYLSHPETWSFLTGNTWLLHVQKELPGVFKNQPTPHVEKAIWTLFYEVLFYAATFVAVMLGILRKRGSLVALFSLAIIATAAVDGLAPDLHWLPKNVLLLGLPFFTGTMAYVFRHRIPLNCGGVALFSIAALAVRGSPLFDPVLVIAIAYGTFWLSFVPTGRIRGFNRVGDYSYGVYIYAWPIQNAVIHAFGEMTPAANIVLSMPLVLTLAAASWHIVERPSLDRKDHLARILSRIAMPFKRGRGTAALRPEP